MAAWVSPAQGDAALQLFSTESEEGVAAHAFGRSEESR